MATPRLDTDRIQAAARALLDDKVKAVRVLAHARQAREDARAALEQAERADTAAYTAALRDGWTADELKRVGLDAPTKRAPGRPRSTAKTSGRSTAAASSPGPDSAPADTAAG
ncbi:hypothetical protein [Aquipuribacter hungaricus]|uniref:Uncharacterized protein n=1 Tax=Aquipuribacter hungaricus TaxID=545624 RepID=A0ABV7WBW0_9MICO